MTEKRYEVGLQLMDKIVEEHESHTRKSLNVISPDFKRKLVKFHLVTSAVSKD